MMANFSRFINDGGVDQWHAGALGIVGVAFVGVVMLVLVAWTLYWKFKALWYAAKHDDKWWFIGLMLINTLGILEIFYLYYWTKRDKMHDESKMPMVQ